MMGVLEMTLPTSCAWTQTEVNTVIKPARKVLWMEIFFMEIFFLKVKRSVVVRQQGV
jgi:hypothetical protein